jgi:dTMP kinase
VQKNKYPGTFIVIEGADGAGTTTQSKKIADQMDAYWTCEPTDNSIGEKVDEMISSDEHSPESIALGFAADRMVHLEEEVIPHLEKGETVICDRYYHSSLIYQSVLGANYKWVKKLNQEALKPDLTFIMDISAEEGMSRVENRGKDGNIFEELDFQQKVVLKYRDINEEMDEEIVLVDASQSEQEVFKSIKTALNQKNLP